MQQLASPTSPGQPSRPMSRALGAAATMYLVAIGAQFVFPGLVLLLLYTVGPSICGLFFASPNGSRETIGANGFTAAFAGGLAGATWIATHPGDMHPVSVVVSCFASFVILTLVSAFVVFLVARRFPAAGEIRPARKSPFRRLEVDEDDD